MPYIAPVIGTTDRLGYTFCRSCGPSPRATETLVYADDGSAADMACDICGTPLPFDRAAKRYVDPGWTRARDWFEIFPNQPVPGR